MTQAGSPDPSIDLICITSFALTNSVGRSVSWPPSCRQHQLRLVVSLVSTQLSYSTSMPQSRRRPQHHKQTTHPRPKSTVVRFTPKSGQTRAQLDCPLSANSRHPSQSPDERRSRTYTSRGVASRCRANSTAFRHRKVLSEYWELCREAGVVCQAIKVPICGCLRFFPEENYG
jgi:hypothetical protein